MKKVYLDFMLELPQLFGAQDLFLNSLGETGKQVNVNNSCAAPRNGKQVWIHYTATELNAWEGNESSLVSPETGQIT